MKKITFTLLLFICFGCFVSAQVMFDYDVETDTKLKENETVADVTIILNYGNTPVKYQIMPFGQSDGVPIKESKFTKKTKYTFSNIPSGKYLIKIINKEGLYAFKPFDIKEE